MSGSPSFHRNSSFILVPISSFSIFSIENPSWFFQAQKELVLTLTVWFKYDALPDKDDAGCWPGRGVFFLSGKVTKTIDAKLGRIELGEREV